MSTPQQLQDMLVSCIMFSLRVAALPPEIQDLRCRCTHRIHDAQWRIAYAHSATSSARLAMVFRSIAYCSPAFYNALFSAKSPASSSHVALSIAIVVSKEPPLEADEERGFSSDANPMQMTKKLLLEEDGGR